jgi:hypothetical protein
VTALAAAPGGAVAADMPTKAPLAPAPAVSSGLFVDASIDGVFVRRNSADGTIVIPIAAPGALISGQDFPFDRTVGGYDARLRVGYGQWGLEGRYLGGLRWNSAVPDLGAVGNFRLGSFSNFGATALSAADRSNFRSVEANLRWQPWTWLTPFAGYRQIKMFDESDFNVAFPAFTALYSFTVPWKAEGPQVGTEIRLFGPGTPWQPGPFFADVDGRIGYYHVSATTNFLLAPSTGGTFTGGSTFSRSNSMIYELGATLGYQVTRNWEVRVGYRFISIADALTANDYAAAATAASTQAVVPNTRRLDLNMATIGTRIVFP